MHYVYILESIQNSRHWYVGVTNDKMPMIIGIR